MKQKASLLRYDIDRLYVTRKEEGIEHTSSLEWIDATIQKYEQK